MTGLASAGRRTPGSAWPAAATALAGAAFAAVGGALIAAGSHLPLAFLLAGTTALAIARFRFAALLLLLLLIPLDRVLIEFLFATGGLLFLVAVTRRLPAPWLSAPWIAFVLLALLSTSWTPGFGDAPSPRNLPVVGWEYLAPTSTAANEWLVMALALAAFLLTARYVRDRRRVEIVVGVILAGAVWPILKGLQQLAQSNYHPAEQATTYQPRSHYNAIQSIFEHPNPFGFYLVLVLIFAIVAIFEVRRAALRVALGILIALAGVCLLNTYTRSAWLAFAVAVVVLGAWRYRSLLLVGIALLPLAGFAAPGAVKQVGQRFGDLASQGESHESNSWDWRREQWTRMIRFGKEKPLTGQGFGSYQRLTVDEFGLEDNRFRTAAAGGTGLGFTAHNDYVKTFVELGWPGLILWAGVLLALVATMVRAARIPAVAPWAVAVGVVGLVVLGLSYSDNVQAGYSVVFFTLFAASAGAVVGAAFPRSQDQLAG
jgi:O-antigen ligase